MSTLSIRLFGKFSAQCDAHDLDLFDARKVQELFCYLLLHRDRPHAREALAGLLWGDCSIVQSRTYLRKALWQLQAALNSCAGTVKSRLLLVESDWIQLDSKADLWLDIAALEQSFALVQGVPGEALEPHCAQTLRAAVELYQGDLLEGWYQDWCLYERERLQHIYLSLLDKLMASCEVTQTYEDGLIYGTRILRYDRAREYTHRRMMRLFYLAGDRTAALRQYERCVAALDEELGTGPAEPTVALYRQIQTNQFDPAALPPPTPLADGSASLPKVLSHLRHLQDLVGEIQRQLRQDIQAVERALNGPR